MTSGGHQYCKMVDFTDRDAERLASTLRCSELLEDSPSTSAQTQRPVAKSASARRARILKECKPSTSTQQFVQVVQRKRPLADARLNTPQRLSIRTFGVDRGIHRNNRTLLNLLRSEESHSTNSHYFEAVQDELTQTHREQAVDWIYEVALEVGCDPDVFPHAVSLIDRFLSVQRIEKNAIQAIAGTCLFISSKLKAPAPMNAEKISYYTAENTTVQEIQNWELFILSTLEWDLTQPTAMDFFDHMAANYHSLGEIREQFITVMHSLQKHIKLGIFLPSLQACLSLLHVAIDSKNVNVINDANHCISEFLQLDINLLAQYLPRIDYCLGRRSTPQVSPQAPPSSTEQRSSPLMGVAAVQGVLVAQSSQVPLTPLNDSGFSSSVGSQTASPEQTSTKDIDSDCSPPKQRRYSTD